MTRDAQTSAAPPRWSWRLTWRDRLHEIVLALLLAGLFWAAWRVEPAFVRWETQVELASHVWELALLALPMTFIIITAGIDLSVGSMMALCSVALGLAFERGIDIWQCTALALLTGTVAGALNGVFISYVRVHPLIVTLATLSAYRGIAEGVSQARPISGFPESFAFFGNGALPLPLPTGNHLQIPVPALLFIVAALLAAILLGKTALGRSLYAIGLNETAARFSGISIERVKLLLYTLSGLAAGIAAVLFTARRNTAKADVGAGIELDVITAVVLGGTNIFGGRGTILGTLLGVLLIHETREFVSWHWNNEELILIVVGALLIGSVLLNRLFAARAK